MNRRPNAHDGKFRNRDIAAPNAAHGQYTSARPRQSCSETKAKLRMQRNNATIHDFSAVARAVSATHTPTQGPRREEPVSGGAFSKWQQVGASLSTEAHLISQPRGQQLEYRLIAVNKAGESTPSNTVAVVL